jgi:endoglucanase
MIVYDRTLTQGLVGLAHARGIPVQDGVFAGYGSDGVAFHDAGSPTALLTIPTRYTHTAFEAVHRRDVEQTVELLRVLVTGGLPERAA